MQVQSAQISGASLLLVANSNANGYFRLTADAGQPLPAMPAFSVPLSTFTTLSGALQLGGNLSLRLQNYTLPSSEALPRNYSIVPPFISFRIQVPSTFRPSILSDSPD